MKIPGYESFRSDRCGRIGGGCILYVHEQLLVSADYTFKDPCNNLVVVYIETLHTIAALQYRPSDSPDADFARMMVELRNCIDIHSSGNRTPDVYLMGDFNLPEYNWNTGTISSGPSYQACLKLQEVINNNFLSQLVMEPTRGKNTLDLILTNKSQDVIEVNVGKPALVGISDHLLVECILGHNPISGPKYEASELDPFSFRAVNYHHGDFEAMNAILRKIDWTELKKICDDEGDMDCSLYKNLLVLTVLQVTLIHAPLKRLDGKAPTNKSDRKINSLQFKKRKLNSKLRKLEQDNPSSWSIPNLHKEVSLVCYEIKDEILAQQNKRESYAVGTIKKNPKYFFSYAKKFANCKSSIAPLKRPSGSLATCPAEKAEILQSQYTNVFSDPDKADPQVCLASLTPVDTSLNDIAFSVDDINAAIGELDPYSAAPDHDIPAKILCSCKDTLSFPLWLLWNSSFENGHIPEELKLQFISPIFKKGNKTDPANYRPVSITSHIIKVFERVLRNNIVDYLESGGIFPDSQHGFRRMRSCLTQLLEHVDYVYKCLNDGNEVDIIYLDYSKAFDKVDHRILLAKLKHYGITGKLFTWIECFLSNRLQAVVVDGKKSTFQEVKSGVPQGTVLGPVFFILYVIDMILKLKSSKPLAFADDTKLLHQIIDMLCKCMLQTDLDRVVNWSLDNNMVLHQDKFEVMNFCLNNSLLLRNLPFTAELRQYTTPDGNILQPTSSVRDLGIYISDDCSWSLQINNVVTDAHKIASWVLGTFRDRSQLTMLTLFKSLIRSRLEYCCPVWDPYLIKDIQAVESIQRFFTKRIAGCKDLDYWDRLKKLHLMSLQRRRERYTIIHTWKILQNKAPNSTGLEFYCNGRLGVKAKILPFNHKAQRSVSTAYDNSFGVKSARLWNLLPKHVNSVTELEAFKVVLGKFLAQHPDKPPVPGYTPPNSNSLLAWSCERGNGVCASRH